MEIKPRRVYDMPRYVLTGEGVNHILEGRIIVPRYSHEDHLEIKTWNEEEIRKHLQDLYPFTTGMITVSVFSKAPDWEKLNTTPKQFLAEFLEEILRQENDLIKKDIRRQHACSIAESFATSGFPS